MDLMKHLRVRICYARIGDCRGEVGECGAELLEAILNIVETLLERLDGSFFALLKRLLCLANSSPSFLVLLSRASWVAENERGRHTAAASSSSKDSLSGLPRGLFPPPVPDADDAASAILK